MTSIPRTVLITGATDGLGLAVAVRLAEAGHDLIIHGRDEGRLGRAVAEVRKRKPRARVDMIMADFLSLHQVEAMAAALLDNGRPIDVLINNAGIGSGYAGRQRLLSQDGIEARFAVNYIAGFHLTERLLPLLLKGQAGRIIHVASLGQNAIDFDDPMIERGFDGQRAYGQSKLAQIMHALDLAERLRGTGVTANALHPASLMPTKIVHEGWGRTIDALETGVEAVLQLAVSPELEGVSGLFFDCQRPGQPLSQATRPEARRALMALSSELVAKALHLPATAAPVHPVRSRAFASAGK